MKSLAENRAGHHGSTTTDPKWHGEILNSPIDQGLSLVEQDDSRSELNSGQEYFGKFVVACRDGSKMLKFIEEALN
jgi:hypothetical protein